MGTFLYIYAVERVNTLLFIRGHQAHPDHQVLLDQPFPWIVSMWVHKMLQFT